MAQFAFARLEDIDSGITGVASITFVIRVVWVGDDLAGRDEVRVVAVRGTTVNALQASIVNAIVARAAALGASQALTQSDIRFIGGLW